MIVACSGDRLAARRSRGGIGLLVEPTCDFLQLLAREHPRLLFGKDASALTRTPYRLDMVALRESLYALVREQHPWLPVPDVPSG